MPNYADGKIYKIICDKSDLIYIGSTCQTLANRLSQHKTKDIACCSSKQLFELGDCKIILIEKFPCKDKDELSAREQYWIDNSSNCVNKQKSYTGLTRKEYNKQYKDINKEKVNEQKLKSYFNHRNENILKMKEYYEKNKEKRKEYDRNRAKLKYACECGSELTINKKSRHMKSKKHIQFMESKQ